MFELVDKDGDGELSQAEVITFVQKVVRFFCGMVKFMAEMVFECFYTEFARVMIGEGWKRAGLKDEMKPEEVTGFVMSAPMLMLQMMQPQQVASGDFKVCVVGGAGGIGQPLALLMATNPLVKELAIIDLNVAMVPAAGVEADLSHIEGKCKVSSISLT